VQKTRQQELKNVVRSEMKIVCTAKEHKFVTNWYCIFYPFEVANYSTNPSNAGFSTRGLFRKNKGKNLRFVL